MPIPGYKILRTLSSNHYRSHFIATEEVTDTSVQIVHFSDDISDTELLLLQSKYDTFNSLAKHGLLSTIRCLQVDGKFTLIIEHFHGENLSNLKYSSIKETLEVFIGLCETINVLHSHDLTLNHLSPVCVFYSPSLHDIKIDASNQPYRTYKHKEKPVLDSIPINELYYISPEMTGRLNREVDYRSNFYSLGIILYELLCGEKPYQIDHEDPIKISHAHIAQTPIDIRTFIPELSPVLINIIDKLLNKMPEQRYQSGSHLLQDLYFYFENIDNKKNLNNFVSAADDTSNVFSLSNKLYGREKELKILETAINNLLLESQLSIFISGPPGTGKSSLVNDVEKKSNKENVFFCKGKFEQYDNNTPFIAFRQVFKLITDQLLILPEDELEKIKNNVTKSIGDNLYILTTFCPELTSIFNTYTSPPLSSSADNDQINRFRNTIINFIKEISILHPLIIVIDDIQWADTSSLELISILSKQKNIKQFLLICTFRNNDENLLKPIEALIDQLINNNHKYEAITLEALSESDIEQMISDSNIPFTNKDLSKTLHNKTNGNPFFIHQLLLSTKDTRNDIDLDNLSDNVFELIYKNISALDIPTQNTLQVFSCLGSSTTARLLSKIIKLPETEIKTHLETAKTNDLLECTNNNYRFQHDRIQQVINERIDEQKKLELHKIIGEALSNQKHHDNIFNTVNHKNKAISLFTSSKERNQLRELNTAAINHSIKNNAYYSAHHYAKFARSLLSTDLPSNLDPSTYDTLYSYAQACYLIGIHESALETASHLLKNGENIQQIVSCYTLYKDIIANRGENFSLAITPLDKIFKILDIRISTNEKLLSEDIIPHLHLDIKNLLSKQDFDGLIQTNKITPPDKKLIMQFLINVWEAAYYAGNSELMQASILEIVRLSLIHGLCNESSFGFVIYALVLSLTNDVPNAIKSGNLSLQIIDKFDNKILLPKVTNLYCNYINFYCNSFIDSAKRYEKSALYAINNGDYLFGVWATCFVVWSHYLGGENLNKIKEIALQHKDFVDQTGDLKMQKVFSMLQDTVHQLTVIDNLGSNYQDTQPDYNEYLSFWKKNSFLPGPTWYAILQTYTNYLSGEFETALSLITSETYINSIDIIMFPATQINFLHALCLAAVYRHRNPNQQKNFILKIEELLSSITELSNKNPDNFKFQEQLIQAELFRLQDSNKARQSYLDAIATSIRSGIIQNVALCNELYAKYLSESSPEEAIIFLIDSIDAYTAWGALRKANLLANEFRYLLPKHLNISNKPKISSTSYSSDLDTDFSFDLTSILKSTQTISSITDTEQLLTTIMSIILDEAGAERGVFITFKDSSYLIRAESTLNNTVLHDNLLLTDFDDVSHSIIRYCIRTSDNILLSNAEKSGPFTNDGYIQNKHLKSVVCTPFYHQDKLYGMLYLENSLTENTFSLSRLKIINIILTQAVISLENSILYTDLTSQIKETKQAENELRISEDRMNRSHIHAKTGTWDWNIETDELFWSDSIGPIFGYTDSILEASYENFIKAVHPDDRDALQTAIQACFDGSDYQINHRIVLPTGEIRWVSETGDVIFNNNEPIRMFGVIQDITNQITSQHEQHELQKQLQQAQKMESIGLLTGGIAHDFNNLIASVLGFTELSIEHHGLLTTDQSLSYLNHIKNAGERARDLVAQLLSFSRGSSSAAVSLDPSPIIIESIKLLSSTIPTNIELSFVTDQAIPNILLDPIQLQQLVINLCLNARDAMDESGKIDVTLKTVDFIKDNTLCASCRNPISGRYVQLSIADTGTGISEENIYKIFEPFFTTKKFGKGSGMGMAMVHGIMHNNNGHILLDSNANGTQIKLFLPISNEKELFTAIEKPHATKAVTHKNILIVDDEEMIAIFLQELLKANDYNAVIYTDSLQAEEAFSANPNDFDLVITDMAMPGLTGDKLSISLLSINPELPIILCTGYSKDIDKESANKIGIKHLMKKPIESSKLLKNISALLL